MIIRRSGGSDDSDGLSNSVLGLSDILVFRYDVPKARFLRVSGREEAFLGYSRADWLAAEFLENALAGDDRTAIRELLGTCDTGEQIVRDCVLLDSAGNEVSAVIAAVASEHHPEQVAGQIILLDPEVVLTRRHLGNQAIHVELMRSVVALFSQISRSLGGYSELLTRHLGAQKDDVGSEYALGIRDSVAALDSAIARLRPMMVGAVTSQDAQDVIELLESDLKAAVSASRGAE